jgi:hypothetical protein
LALSSTTVRHKSKIYCLGKLPHEHKKGRLTT